MQRTYIKDLQAKIGEEVLIKGWVDVRRDHGKIVFLDIRDESGKAQSVVVPNSESYEPAQTVRSEWVIESHALVKRRPEKMIKPGVINGDLELELRTLTVLNKAETPPFDISTDGKEIGEDSRLQYRYVDLRRERLQRNIRFRNAINKAIRDSLIGDGFNEIETPILTKSTPEGARDYIVPSRLYKGKFYALPQSPQQYKQLLMASGFEKYFQIARCFRDEDTRGDRQPEFTQLDMEMAFVEREDVMAVTEKLLIHLVQTLAPQKKIQELPFPRISYHEAMERYGIDRPDIRTDKNDPDLLAFCWVIDFPFFEKTESGGWTFTHNPFSSPKKEHMDLLMQKQSIADILTTQYDIVLNGFEIGGGSIRNHNPEALKKVFEIMGFADERIERNFGHMLTALGSGTPPHGGIAWGLDRLITLLCNEPNIREVIAFPKTGEGRDLLMDSPAPVDTAQLTELGVRIKEEEKK